jgi:hypothetical protein
MIDINTLLMGFVVGLGVGLTVAVFVVNHFNQQEEE